MSRPRTNICLSMIVKNEARVLPRLFRSLKDYIDYYVIVDTGSTDDTIDLIGREMAGYGIDGVVYEREWVNFGANRQEALDLTIAANKADWALFIDADEELGVSDAEFYKSFEAGVSYDVEKHHSGVRYAVPNLVNIKETRWQWKGPVHNYLEFVSGKKDRRLRKDVWIIYHPGEGAKSHGVNAEEKYLRDAEILKEDLRLNPDSTRSQFYLGQSYKHAGHPEQAYEAYERRTQMKGWAEEDFIAQLELGRIGNQLKLPEERVVAHFLAAYELRPSRAEPLHELARYFRLKKQHGRAYLFAKAGSQIPRPDDALFVSQEVYDWRLLDELGVAAYWVGQYSESKDACEAVLHRVGQGLAVPDGDVARLKENLAYANAKLSSG